MNFLLWLSGLLFLLAFFAVFVSVVVLAGNITGMFFDKDLQVFPSVTRCRLCEKRVFVWQKHERRNANVVMNNPQQIAMSCSASTIVHKNCKGVPDFSVSVRLGSG